MLLQWFFTAAEAVVIVTTLAMTIMLFASQSMLEAKDESSKAVTVRLDAAELALDLPAEAYELTSETFPGETIRVDNLRGSIEVVNPEDAEPFLRVIRTPLSLFFIFVGLVGGAICEFFRRLFKNVRLGQSFLPANISNLHKIGILVVLLEIGSSVLMVWSHSSAINFVREHVKREGIHLVGPAKQQVGIYRSWFVNGYPVQINLMGIVAGLMILALGEAFRQGLELKQDSELTI